VNVASVLDSTSSLIGSIKTAGGLGVAKDVRVGATLHAVDVRGTNAYQQVSDERFKTDIQQLKKALEKLTRLRGVKFRFKAKDFPDRGFDENQHIGFLAQEVERVIPEMVKTDTNGWKTVAYSELIPYLVEALKMQDQTVKAQGEALKMQDQKIKAQGEAIVELQKLLQGLVVANLSSTNSSRY